MPKKTGIYLAEQPVFPLAGFVSIKESFANNRQAVLPEIGNDIQLPPPMTHQNHSAGLPSIVASSVGKVGFLWITGVYAGYNHAYNTSNAPKPLKY